VSHRRHHCVCLTDRTRFSDSSLTYLLRKVIIDRLDFEDRSRFLPRVQLRLLIFQKALLREMSQLNRKQSRVTERSGRSTKPYVRRSSSERKAKMDAERKRCPYLASNGFWNGKQEGTSEHAVKHCLNTERGIELR